jgi:lipoprotein signal peptidase
MIKIKVGRNYFGVDGKISIVTHFMLTSNDGANFGIIRTYKDIEWHGIQMTFRY